MNRGVRIALIGWLVCLLGGAPVSASGPFDKLGRGAANTVTGWLELPIQITRTTELEGSLAGLSVGLIRGLGSSLGRTTVGAYETLTFLLPNYTRQANRDSYGPILEPAFIVFRNADKL